MARVTKNPTTHASSAASAPSAIISCRALDEDIILESVRKTSRLLVVHEANVTGGFGAEVAAMVNEKAFDWLDAPVKRLGAPGSSRQ